ncbi:MAG: hypothetical protein Q9220_007486 [cf. Caloplaca sp. 1 TL-2023]
MSLVTTFFTLVSLCLVAPAFGSPAAAPPPVCNADNCLRAFQGYGVATTASRLRDASAFCSSYISTSIPALTVTTSTNAQATTTLPTSTNTAATSTVVVTVSTITTTTTTVPFSCSGSNNQQTVTLARRATTAPFPTYATACTSTINTLNQPARVSSACSCLLIATPATTTVTQTSTATQTSPAVTTTTTPVTSSTTTTFTTTSTLTTQSAAPQCTPGNGPAGVLATNPPCGAQCGIRGSYASNFNYADVANTLGECYATCAKDPTCKAFGFLEGIRFCLTAKVPVGNNVNGQLCGDNSHPLSPNDLAVMIAEILLSIGIAYTAWSWIALEINYRRASSMGIPLLRLFIDPQNVPWLLLEPLIWRVLDLVPLDWGTFGRYSRRGWHFRDKADSHLKYGAVWALVTPRDIYVYVADPDAITDIFHRRGDFLRPSKLYSSRLEAHGFQEPLELYGPCISTASWKDWPRHRKVLAAPFNENIMQFVWIESLKQSKQMVHSWVGKSGTGISSASRDTRTLSLNVLAATGFQRSYEFRSSDETPVDEAGTYRDALQTVLDNAILLMILPAGLLSLPFLPRSWTRVSQAATAFKQYMVDMLDQETSLQERGDTGTGSLMTSFVRALDVSRKEEAAWKPSEDRVVKGLTVDEIFGNIFVINFAGHDTTANTLAFAFLLLAAHPEVQDWVAEEVQHFTSSNNCLEWDYDKTFSNLKRCRAVLPKLESLRLFPPIMALPKWTDDHPHSLQIGQKTIIIPPHTGVMPSLLAVQTHPNLWENPLRWQPDRWISSRIDQHREDTTSDKATRLRLETIITTEQCTYFPWSDGPQNCPGAKFAQVEFVAVLACVLRDHRMRVVRKPGESLASANERVMATTEDCDMTLLLRMRDADSVRLFCEPVLSGTTHENR